MLKKIICVVTFVVTAVSSKVVPAKNFASLMKELREVEDDIKLKIDSIEANHL
jgi:ABC-type siderophore export system fused ATPase/permease subunit